jgi:glucose-6-phosphate 1-dehydrogenase
VEEAWRVVDPVLDLPEPVDEYASGSWGPASARTMVEGDAWHDPAPEGSAPC